MANVSRTVDIIFNGKDKLSGPVGKIVKGFKTLNKAADFTIEKIDMVADKFKIAAAAATGMAVAFGIFAVSKFKDFESAWIDLDKILSETERETLPAAEQAVRRMAIEFGESMVSITHSVIDFHRAGMDLNESLIMVRNGLNLASAGNVEMQVSTQYLIQIMKGFKFQVKDMGHVVDAVNIVSDKYATTVEELGRALARAAPAAKAAGISFDHLVGLATPIIEIFQSGEEAGTAMRRGFIKLTDDAKPVTRALKGLGVAQREGPNKELRKGVDILNDMAKALATNVSSQKRLAVVAEIFGSRQGAKLVALFEDYGYVLEIQGIAKNVDFAYTLEQVAKKLASTRVRIGALMASLEYFGIVIGRKLKPGFEEALRGIEGLLHSMSDSVRAALLDDLFQHFEYLGIKLRDFFKGIGDALSDALKEVDYRELLLAVESFIGRLGEAFDGLDLTKPEDLAKAIQFVIDTMTSGIETAEGMIDVYDKLKRQIISVIDRYNKMESSQKKAHGRTLATADVLEALGKTFGGLLLSMESFGEKVMAATETLGLFGRRATLAYTLVGQHMATVFAVFVAGLLQMLKLGTLGMSDTINTATEGAIQTLSVAKAELAKTHLEYTITGKKLIGTMDRMAGAADETNSMFAKFKKTLDAILEEPEKKIELKVETNKDEALGEVDKILVEAKAKLTGMEKIELEVTLEDPFKEERQDLYDWALGQGEYEGMGKMKWTDEALKAYDRLTKKLKKGFVVTGLEELTPKEIDKLTPAEKKFEAAQKRILEEIKANTEIVKENFKSAATAIEADAKKVSASFESIGEAVGGTGTLLGDLYKQLATGDVDFTTRYNIEKQIKEETKRREEAFELQKRMTEAQLELMERRAAAMDAGNPLITVSGDGLQPHLESIMWEVFSAIQVRVNEDYDNFLLGLRGAV